MKALVLFLVVFLMNIVKCPGCSRSFDQGIAIKAHQRTCAGLHFIGQKRINKRHQNNKRHEEVKVARIEGQTVDNVLEECQALLENLDNNMVTEVSDASTVS